MSQSNGHGPQGPAQLIKLLEYHEHVVASIRTTLEVLGAKQQASSSARAATTIAQAATLDRTRTGHARRQLTGLHTAQLKARRQRTADYLAQFSTTEPRPAKGDGFRGFGPLIVAGYLKKRGKGYLRTAKVFTP